MYGFFRDSASALAPGRIPDIIYIVTPQVKCPRCHARGHWFESEWGPFCSSRCQLIDLRKWLVEENVISTPLSPEHFEDDIPLSPSPPPDRKARRSTWE